MKKEVKAIKQDSKKITANKKAARDFLVRHGFVDTSGKLTDRYK